MNILPRSRRLRFDEPALLADIMAMGASIGQEISQKWAFLAARIHIQMFGALGLPERQPAIGKALTLGLSGIVDGAANARKIAGVLALQERMMAVRLAGRKLVAFHPDRDLQFNPERLWLSAGRLRASVWSASGESIGSTERLVRCFDQATEPDHDSALLASSARPNPEVVRALAGAGWQRGSA